MSEPRPVIEIFNELRDIPGIQSVELTIRNKSHTLNLKYTDPVLVKKCDFCQRTIHKMVNGKLHTHNAPGIKYIRCPGSST